MTVNQELQVQTLMSEPIMTDKYETFTKKQKKELEEIRYRLNKNILDTSNHLKNNTNDAQLGTYEDRILVWGEIVKVINFYLN